LIGKIVDEGEFEGIPVYTNVNTRVYRGKNISTMAGLVVKMGFKIPETLSPRKLALYMEAALRKEPVVKGKLDWRGAYSFTNTKGETEYENVYRHYKDFPEDPDNTGVRQHVVQVTNKHNGGMAEVRAQTQISEFFSKTDVIPVKGDKKLVSAPRLVAKVAEVPELVMSSTPTIVTGKGQAQATIASTDEDDLKLMLEG
jgi:hypothetical protein